MKETKYGKEIPGYNDYTVSESGDVYSWKKVLWGYSDQPTLMKGIVNKAGYKIYCLNGDRLSGHKLVLMTYVGENPKDKPLIRHLDGNPSNNKLSNLCYGDVLENYKDSVVHGTNRIGIRGQNNVNAKLTDKEVFEIKTRLLIGERVIDLAAEYGVRHSLISMIKTGKRWAHITVCPLIEKVASKK